MKKFVVILFLIVLSALLFACLEPNLDDEPVDEWVDFEGTSYGIVHEYYVGVVEVVLAEDGKVKSASLEEYYLPHHWAQVSDETDGAVAVGSNHYAKYVKIGDRLFEGVASGYSGSQAIVYSTSGVPNLGNWLTVEENAKWYVEQIEAGAYFISNRSGTDAGIPITQANAAVSMKKSESNYWPSTHAGGIGWIANRDAFIAAIIGTKVDQSLTANDQNDAEYWVIGGEVSGATFADFIDYYNLAKRAVANAK